MKGILKKTEQGWFVVYDKRTMQDPSAEDGILPLHFKDVKLFTQYTDYSIDWDGKKIEWDRITEWNYDRTTYAKLIETNENGRPLTYWGGLGEPKQELHTCKYCKAKTTQPDDECYAKPKQESYICPITKIQCDDECCVSAENCNIDNDELEYPISDDCEEVKNWDSFVEQKNKELFYQKQVMNPYSTGSQSYTAYEKGFAEGYNKEKESYYELLHKSIDYADKKYLEGFNKAKETLYTEEQMELCWIAAMSNRAGFSDSISYKEFIQSLKQ